MKNKMLRPIVIILFLICSGILFVQCSNSKEKTYKIGSILPLTGNAAFLGETVRNAILMAEEEINSKGGINQKKLEVIIEDSNLNATKGVSIANKFINIDNIKVLHTWGTSVSLAVQPIARQRQIVQMVTSIHPAIIDNNEYTFRLFYNVMQATTLFELYLKNTRPSTIGFLYQNGEAWLSQINQLEPRLKELGIQVVYNETFNTTQNEFSPFAVKLSKAAPEILLVLGYGAHFPALFKALHEFKALDKVQVLGGLDFLEISPGIPKQLFEGTVFVVPAVSLSLFPAEGTKFAEKYQERFGQLPNHQAMYAYDIILLLSEAFRKVGDNPQKIKDYLSTIKGYQGASGLIDILPNGDVKTALKFATYKNQQIIEYEF